MDRVSVAWRVAICLTVPNLFAEVVSRMVVGLDTAPSFITIGALTVGPILGLCWARAVVPAAANTSFLGLIPIYLSLLVWLFKIWIPLRVETHLFLVRWGISWELAGVLATAADPIGYGLVTSMLAFGTASWQSGSPARDVIVVIGIVVFVFVVISIVPLVVF